MDVGTSRPCSGGDRSLLGLLAALALFALLVLKNAWVSDDAYITFRSIDNLVSGHGPVYNVGERVQSFTHPLWMLILAALHFATRELYFTSLAVSLLLGLLTVWLVFDRGRPAASWLGIAVLAGSKAFVDYSTSGLENPLSHALLALFLREFLDGAETRPARLSLLAALAALTRLDALVLYLPALLLVLRRAGLRGTPGPLLAGGAPLLLWTLFSLFYYGAPVANSAYAKLATGIAQPELARQAAFYFLDSLRSDPLTLAAIGAGCALALWRRKPRELAVAAGIVLYLAYIVRIGGDFMSGRFFALPLLAAAVLVVRGAAAIPTRWKAGGFAALGLLALVSAEQHLLSGPRFGDVPRIDTPGFGPLPLSLIDEHGVCDERAFYYPATGLLRPGGGATPTHQWVDHGRALGRGGPSVHVVYALGILGFHADSRQHLIDRNGLNDYLLARLPIPAHRSWRIGHFVRDLPPGYVESVASGQNRIAHPGLARYYDAVASITRGDLWSARRLAAIWSINTGAYDDLLRSYVEAAER